MADRIVDFKPNIIEPYVSVVVRRVRMAMRMKMEVHLMRLYAHTNKTTTILRSKFLKHCINTNLPHSKCVCISLLSSDNIDHSRSLCVCVRAHSPSFHRFTNCTCNFGESASNGRWISNHKVLFFSHTRPTTDGCCACGDIVENFNQNSNHYFRHRLN